MGPNLFRVTFFDPCTVYETKYIIFTQCAKGKLRWKAHLEHVRFSPLRGRVMASSFGDASFQGAVAVSITLLDEAKTDNEILEMPN